MKKFILNFLQIFSALTLIAILLFTFVSAIIQDFDNIEYSDAVIINIVDDGINNEYVAVANDGIYYTFIFNDFSLNSEKSFDLIFDNNGTRKDKTDDIIIGFVYDEVDIYF